MRRVAVPALAMAALAVVGCESAPHVLEINVGDPDSGDSIQYER